MKYVLSMMARGPVWLRREPESIRLGRLRSALFPWNPLWPFVILFHPTKKHLRPGPGVYPNGAGADSLLEMFPRGGAISVRQPEKAELIMHVELFPTRCSGLGQ